MNVKFYKTLRSVLNDECQHIIEKCERIGFEEHKDRTCITFEDSALSFKLYWTLKKYFFNKIHADWVPSFIHYKFKVYKSTHEKHSCVHKEPIIRRKIIINGIEKMQQSFMVIMVYLNDDFTSEHNDYLFGKNFNEQVQLNVETGLCVMQNQNIIHESGMIKTGVKYVLKTYLIYEKIIERPENLMNKKKNYIGEWKLLHT